MNGTSLRHYWRDDLNATLAASRARTLPGMADASRWMLVWAGATLLILLMLLTGGYHAAFHVINGMAPALPPRFWEWLTVLGDGRVAFALALIFARRRPEVFWALVLAGICGLLYTHSLKPWFGMLRPPAVLEAGGFNLIGPAHKYRSFPSGHSLTAALFLGVWLWFVRGWRLRLALILFASGIALSRVVVGVHWPVDVAAGILGGCLAAWAGVRLSLRWRGGLSLPGHLVCLFIGMAYAISLFLDDGGYRQAALLQILLALTGYFAVFYDYCLAPCRRWRLAQVADPGGQDLRDPDRSLVAMGYGLPLVLLLCFLSILVFLIWPGLDPAVSAWFYRVEGGFFLSSNGLVQFSYQLFARIHFLVAPLLLLLLVSAFYCKGRTKPILYLLAVLIVGPGLLVNEVLKAESGRARPLQTERFGGEKAFTPPFVSASQCKDNCSFVSGHAAMGFFFLALAWVFGKRRWLVLGIVLGSLVGLGRILQGGHFLSDVVFAFWVVYFTALFLAWLFFGTTRIEPKTD
ncbi:MAG: phosphatase PAP2 family protein [Gammaproteobacteria bacterium]|nr:phosphatase PAP2 family protein [Gammaproteobacteria bacterium]MBU1655660.1 phosphatase PAP2 family protein [Gammaproteobacteria bacterium]MBU1960313.1 phosphatase PAP2 family protein [Gammaproteobacteria bacterium]